MSDIQNTGAGRQLSEQEQKRVAAFALTEDKMKGKGYVRKDLTITIQKANIVGPLLVLPFMAAVCIAFILIRGTAPVTAMLHEKKLLDGILLIVAGISMIPLAVVHEFIHGLTWGIFAENHMKDIEYGFIKEMITPYCYCRAPLSKGQYILGSMMPMTILGLGLSILGIVFSIPALTIAGLLQLLGGSGDILITSILLRYKTQGKDFVIMDHPTECGLVVFEKADKA